MAGMGGGGGCCGVVIGGYFNFGFKGNRKCFIWVVMFCYVKMSFLGRIDSVDD